MIPTVSLIVDIPTTIDGSRYDGQVLVSLKDAVFEPSSALRHATELNDILMTRLMNKSLLCLYTVT